MNYLAIILGFSELLLQEAAPDDPRRADLEEIHKAATAASVVVREGDRRRVTHVGARCCS